MYGIGICDGESPTMSDGGRLIASAGFSFTLKNFVGD